MRGYRLLRDAAVELEEAASYYEDQSEGLGLDFLEEFERAMDLITEVPEAWSPVDSVFRRFLLRRFPFCVFYREDGDVIVVTSVFHQHRKPESWKRNR